MFIALFARDGIIGMFGVSDRAAAQKAVRVMNQNQSAALLEARNVSKRFGALAASSDINFRLDAGARHALIGPNGAGKTTFINLLTGVLAPTEGQIVFSGEDVTMVSQAQRVKRGIARTFQINRLFRGLSVLENVYIPVSEHLGVASSMFRPAGRRPDVIDAAMNLLEMLKLQDVAGHKISELPYGRQRLVEIAIALGLAPRVLLLDEPAAGVPSAESHIILDAIDRLPKEIAVLIIEHDMDLVFRFAERITVLVGGRIFAEGTPKEIGANPDVRAVYLGQATTWLARLAWKNLSAGYGETVVLEDIDLSVAPGESLSIIGRNGVGKTTLLATTMGHTTLRGGAGAARWPGHFSVPIYRRALKGLGFVPQEREIFPSLTVKENLGIAARPGYWNEERIYELFPRLNERLSNMGNQLSGGEQQMLSIARALMTNPCGPAHG